MRRHVNEIKITNWASLGNARYRYSGKYSEGGFFADVVLKFDTARWLARGWRCEIVQTNFQGDPAALIAAILAAVNADV